MLICFFPSCPHSFYSISHCTYTLSVPNGSLLRVLSTSLLFLLWIGLLSCIPSWYGSHWSIVWGHGYQSPSCLRGTPWILLNQLVLIMKSLAKFLQLDTFPVSDPPHLSGLETCTERIRGGWVNVPIEMVQPKNLLNRIEMNNTTTPIQLQYCIEMWNFHHCTESHGYLLIDDMSIGSTTKSL